MSKDFLISLPFKDGGQFVVFFAATGVEQGLLFTDLLVIILIWNNGYTMRLKYNVVWS